MWERHVKTLPLWGPSSHGFTAKVGRVQQKKSIGVARLRRVANRYFNLEGAWQQHILVHLLAINNWIIMQRCSTSVSRKKSGKSGRGGLCLRVRAVCSVLTPLAAPAATIVVVPLGCLIQRQLTLQGKFCLSKCLTVSFIPRYLASALVLPKSGHRRLLSLPFSETTKYKNAS